MLDIAVIGLSFILILPAELPDKTFIATLVLSTRYRRLPVWIGVAAAFAVQSAVAVTAGGLLSLLPQRLVLGLTFLLFAAGAVLMLVSGLGHARPRSRPRTRRSSRRRRRHATPRRPGGSP